jgi:hypothetical protein
MEKDCKFAFPFFMVGDYSIPITHKANKLNFGHHKIFYIFYLVGKK